MKFFSAGDFYGREQTLTPDRVANMVNAKLEREGIPVFIFRASDKTINSITSVAGYRPDLFQDKALMISIEPIEQLEKCNHPNEKIKFLSQSFFQCECGKQMKPTAFEEIPERIKPIEKCVHGPYARDLQSGPYRMKCLSCGESFDAIPK